MDALSALAAGLRGGMAFAGLALAGPDGVARFGIATAPGIAAGPGTLWRAASLSKIVTGRTLRAALLAAGIARPADAAAEDLLGFPLRHPDAPDRPLTVGQIATHRAGLTDEAGYLIPAGERLSDWIAGRAVWGPRGAVAYCNLGYVLLAACAERAAGERLDTLARRLVLDPLGIAGGFNWSGVADRSDRIATYRNDRGRLVAQIDATVAPDGVCDATGAAIDLSAYRPGDNPGLFSPQGGLRLSLAGALRLAGSLGKEVPLWRCPEGTGGLFQSWGWGVQILHRPPFWPRPLIGHFGNAYGFRGGLWHDPEARLSLVVALNGEDADAPDDDALTATEAAAYAGLAAIAG